ncbi:MAG: MFS transporter [Rhodoluna sp.]|nr:MFS transporter [Rhodoluna sp.]
MTNEPKATSKLATWAWSLWDWAEQPYPTIIQTFIFATYITSSYFGDPHVLSAQLGIAGAIAGVAVAISAPVFGRRSDDAGNRKRWLLINSGVLIAIMVASYFVAPSPEFLIFGLVLYALGSVVQETAFINYYAMLKQVTTPKNIGKVSGFAWGLGYVGGIILLLVSLIGFVLPDNPWFGVSTENAENIRVLYLFAAAWMFIFTIPLALFVPEVAKSSNSTKVTIVESYKALFRQIVALRKRSPEALKFLIASAVYRDGLAGVFTFGAILGSVAFGFSKTGVIFFGIAANIVAGIGAALGGIFDDRIGTKRTIVGSLAGLVIAGLGVFAFAGIGQITYWIGGLALCLFVGPAQASSRTFVARFTPDGREGEIFGLYQTTGRAASFLSPTLWTISLSLAAAAGIANTAIFGILGIVLVLVVGLVMMARVHPAPELHKD